METLLYLLLAAVLYGFLADRTDLAVEREMCSRRHPGLRLVDDLDEAEPGSSGPGDCVPRRVDRLRELRGTPLGRATRAAPGAKS